MLGMIFTELVELVEDKFSPELADEILTEANFAHGGSYTSVGYYDHEEIVRLVTLLSEKTGVPAGDLIVEFGKHLFASFTQTHARILADKKTMLDLL
ncbi:MAG: heme NO-binding domain-containing protein, partial [Oceanobacter sp.]